LNIPDRIAATEHMHQHGLDFDDATTLQAMKVHGINEIMSYDEHFDEPSGIRRRRPEELG